MSKVSKKPTGFYTGKEAAQRLDMKLSTFYEHAKKGQFNKVMLPGKSEGYFPKETIDKIAQARELALILYSIEPVIFSRAQSEEDIKGIVDLCIAIYGQGGTPSIEARMEIWHKNPEVYYVVKQEGIVVGYISMIWFTDESLKTIMGPTPKYSHATEAGRGIYAVMGAENVRTYTEGQPIDSLFISLAVRPGMTNAQQREYGFKLIRDSLDILIDFARRGMPVKRLYATSEKGDGIQIARKLGMHEIRYDNENLLRFELDFENATRGMAKEYRDFVDSLHNNKQIV